MAKRKDILTTGQVAQICKVAPRTVTKWFDSGQLKGYRIPGSRDRRIPASELLRFMKAHNIPTNMLDAGKLRVLVIDSDWEIASSLAQALKSRGNYDTQIAQTSFDAGAVVQKFNPHVVLINLLAEGVDAGAICRNIRSNEDLQAVKVIALADRLSESENHALLKKGFDAALPRNAEVTETIKKIEEVTAIIY
jgi:excisionase family DNA binding protein